MKLKDEIGWDRITERAIDALEELPGSTVLAGISMGCGVVASVWLRRPETKGILLLHALAGIPATKLWNGLPLQLHLGADDQLWAADEIGRWSAEAQRAEISTEIFVYPGAGHFFTDSSLRDYKASTGRQTLESVVEFLLGQVSGR
jgi:dienelactone hydrolase